MKNFLLTQSTEYDCGPVTLVNALRFLFEREEIPPALIRAIWLYANDTYNAQGQKGTLGTSKACIRFLGNWFTDFGKNCSFPIRAEFVEGADTAIAPGSPTVRCLESGGAALMHCFLEEDGHYVLLTGMTGEGDVTLFDPYDVADAPPAWAAAGVRVIRDQPCAMNRVLTPQRLNAFSEEDYAMGPLERRENLLIWNTRTEHRAEESAHEA